MHFSLCILRFSSLLPFALRTIITPRCYRNSQLNLCNLYFVRNFWDTYDLGGLHSSRNSDVPHVFFSFLVFCQVSLFGSDRGMAQFTKTIFTAIRSFREPDKFTLPSFVVLSPAIVGSLPLWRHKFLTQNSHQYYFLINIYHLTPYIISRWGGSLRRQYKFNCYWLVYRHYNWLKYNWIIHDYFWNLHYKSNSHIIYYTPKWFYN